MIYLGKWLSESLPKKCLEIHKLDSGHFLSAPELAWQAHFKKTGEEQELLNNTDMQLMIEKGIRGLICHVITRYAKANDKYMSTITKAKSHGI